MISVRPSNPLPRPEAPAPRTPRLPVRPTWWVLALLGVLMASGSAAAAAAVVVHGKGELVSQPLTGDLQVVTARLDPLLVPGQASDLVIQVRNRSAFTVVADRVRLASPPREESPAGCLAKLSGPLLRETAGVKLAGGQRVALAPGRDGQVVVPGALSLATSAKGGCGFRVVVDVQAVRQAPTTTPPTTPTTTPTPTTVTPTTHPSTVTPTTHPSTVTPTEPTTVATSATVSAGDTSTCDPAAPVC